jgi:hypothetical protein
MGNPLGTGGMVARTREWPAGESRSIGGSQGSRTITVHRTDRPYVFDLCETYNREMGDEARSRGKEWFVTKDGTLMLGYTLDEEKRLMTKLRAESALFGDG